MSSETIKYQNTGRLKLCIITICISAAYYGWAIVDLSAVPQKYLAQSYGSLIQDSPVIYGILQGCVPAGAIIGAAISSILMKLFTRK
jgi:hypothetical protein